MSRLKIENTVTVQAKRLFVFSHMFHFLSNKRIPSVKNSVFEMMRGSCTEILELKKLHVN